MEPSHASSIQTQFDRAKARLGQLIEERWYLETLLGVGGMAAVYKATHYRNGRAAALKIIHEELAANQEIRDRFFLEAYATNRVDHPGVVPALDDGMLEDGTPYLVMEYLEGETLDASLRDKEPRHPSEVLWIADHLLDILGAAHRARVIHRDIKPENVFISSNQEVRLLDFGIAQLKSQMFPTQTQIGRVMGTPAFMPPEQARGRWEEVDHRSDLFSVAATMYTMLSGRVPREAETVNEYLLAAMTEPTAPLRSVAPRVPEVIARLVDKALSFDKKDRFSSAEEMQNAVRDARTRLSSSLSGESCICYRPRLESAVRARDSRTTSRAVVNEYSSLPDAKIPKPASKLAWSFSALLLAGLGAVAITQAGKPSEESKNWTNRIADVGQRALGQQVTSTEASYHQESPLPTRSKELLMSRQPIMQDAPLEFGSNTRDSTSTILPTGSTKLEVKRSSSVRYSSPETSTNLAEPKVKKPSERESEQVEESTFDSKDFDPLARRR